MSTPQRPSNTPPDDLPERVTSDEDRALLSGQARSVGSGVLGGWSQAVLGGPLGRRERLRGRRSRRAADQGKRLEGLARRFERSSPCLSPAQRHYSIVSASNGVDIEVSYGVIHHSKKIPVVKTACGLAARDPDTGMRNICPSSPNWETVSCPKCIAARGFRWLPDRF
ncbi:MAG TPA: hypothetical protein VGL59_11890 [Polyangia bacterium]|jgi:hypothetical protein